MTFAELGLNSALLQSLSAMGYAEPTPVQAQAIPLALEGRDLIASANTGTGKTAAFVLPALQRLATPAPVRPVGPRVLVLSPTRELAGQILTASRRYAAGMRCRSGAVVGGMPYAQQLRMLQQSLDFLVATPGRLIDHLDRRRVNLSSVELLVLDEADRMLDMGFIDDVERIAAACPAARQTLMFTATWDGRMGKLAARLLKDPARVDVVGGRAERPAIDQKMLRVDDQNHKKRLLNHLLAEGGVEKAIVFVATKADTEVVAEELSALGHAAGALHGDMRQAFRDKTIRRLRRGELRVLVATDVAARGLDISDISHVVNFDLPMVGEDYVHRIGRTGRAGASGTAWSLIGTRDMRRVRDIEKALGHPVTFDVIPGFEPKGPAPREGHRGPRPAGASAKRRSAQDHRGSSWSPLPERQRGQEGDERRSKGGGKPFRSERKFDGAPRVTSGEGGLFRKGAGNGGAPKRKTAWS